MNFKIKQTDAARLNDGTIVKVGDWVQFKWDEQNGGRITQIVINPGGEVLFLENTSKFRGQAMDGKTTTRIAAHECWVER
jgi:hypothetical protein